jgi:hypothetical protein
MKVLFLVGAMTLATSVAHATEPSGTTDGTTVVGERETALGLVLTPWPDEGPAPLDRPPALLDELPSPTDAEAHARSTRFERDLAGWRRARVEPSR